jgi:tetratricopeptide (TPR) repeat protein
MRRLQWKILLLVCFLQGRAFCQQPASPGADATIATRESAESHLGKAYDSLKQEKYEDAEKEFRAALVIDPSLVLRARFPLAVALFEQRKYVESRREFEAVRRAAGDQPGIFYYLGRIDLEQQNFKGAIAKLEKASTQPPFPDTAFYLGLAQLKLGSNQAAEKWLKKATEANPSDSRAEYELAKLYRKEGREEEAKQAFARSKEIQVQSGKRSQLRFQCGQELDRIPAGQAPSCEQLVATNNAEQLAALGVLYGQHGQLEKALTPLQRAAELSPQSPQMQYNLAFTYYQLKRFPEARASLETAAQRWPDLFPISALYGAVLWSLGEAKPAYDVLHHAHLLNSQDAGTTALLYQSTLQLARQSDKADAVSDALRYLQEAVSLAPADPEPHRIMAALYRRTGRPAQADQEDQKAAEISRSRGNLRQ